MENPVNAESTYFTMHPLVREWHGKFAVNPPETFRPVPNGCP